VGVFDRLAARLTVAAAGERSSVANQIGSARLSHQLATLEGLFSFRPEARVQPFVGVGAGAYRIGVAGVSNDPTETWKGRSTQMWTAALDATAGASVAIGQHIALVIAAEALMFLNRPVIELGDAPADARVGQAG